MENKRTMGDLIKRVGRKADGFIDKVLQPSYTMTGEEAEKWRRNSDRKETK